MIRGLIFFKIVSFFISACSEKPKTTVDLILYNAKIYTVNEDFEMAQAIAIQADTIVAIGSNKDILNHYQSAKTIDLDQKTVFPGLIDAHSHFYGYGKNLQELNLKGVGSLEEMINLVVSYASKTAPTYIIGRGWDENNWHTQGSINKSKLDVMFPTVPVFLQRVDGHSALCNQVALDMAGIGPNTYVNGGEVEVFGDIMTGIVKDKAMDLVKQKLPIPDRSFQNQILMDAQKSCFSYGLTTVCDAGLPTETIELMDSMANANQLKIRLYAMFDPDTAKIITFWEKHPNLNKRLKAHSIKLYGDGSVGSSTACLKHPYADNKSNYGFIIENEDFYRSILRFCYNRNLQANTHCIGDSANKYLLGLYADILEDKNDNRWRIEHAQLVDNADIDMFGRFSIIPSVQPTHATSDFHMFNKNVGLMNPSYNAGYNYKSLLMQNNYIAFGTDFPVEGVNPLNTFFSATKRKTSDGEIFNIEQAVTTLEALKAMTIWAAKANFMENEVGSLEVGKKADLCVFSDDFMYAQNADKILCLMTICGGEVVFDVR
ncbi:MAG: amidohydrolase [Flavobacteriales bacterium]|nr:amidohydrolase [Flavobacteriales bacterium]